MYLKTNNFPTVIHSIYRNKPVGGKEGITIVTDIKN